MADSRSKIPVTSPTGEKAASLAVQGELTLANLASFRANVLETLDRTNDLILRLDGATYLDAAAFQCIYALRREASHRGSSLTIENVPDAIRADAAMLGMTAVFDDTVPKEWSCHGEASVGDR